MRVFAVFVASVILTVMVCLIALPRLITGDYAEIRINNIEFTSDGRFDIQYSGTCTSGHFVRGEHEALNRPMFYDGSASGQTGFGYPHTLQSESRWSPSQVPDIESKLLVSEGETYRIEINDPLVLFDLERQAGRSNRGVLALVRQKSCQFSILK